VRLRRGLEDLRKVEFDGFLRRFLLSVRVLRGHVLEHSVDRPDLLLGHSGGRWVGICHEVLEEERFGRSLGVGRVHETTEVGLVMEHTLVEALAGVDVVRALI